MINVRWTDTDIATMKKAYLDGVSDRDVATLLDRTVGSVQVKRSRLDINFPLPGRNGRDWILIGCRRTMADIIADVSRRTGVPVIEIRGLSRFKSISHARQIFMAEAYATGRFSLPQIGRFLGGRDHTTILSGIRRHAERTAQGVHNTDQPLADL